MAELLGIRDIQSAIHATGAAFTLLRNTECMVSHMRRIRAIVAVLHEHDPIHVSRPDASERLLFLLRPPFISLVSHTTQRNSAHPTCLNAGIVARR
jgi:hypothetical protein